MRYVFKLLPYSNNPFEADDYFGSDPDVGGPDFIHPHLVLELLQQIGPDSYRTNLWIITAEPRGPFSDLRSALRGLSESVPEPERILSYVVGANAYWFNKESGRWDDKYISGGDFEDLLDGLIKGGIIPATVKFEI